MIWFVWLWPDLFPRRPASQRLFWDAVEKVKNKKIKKEQRTKNKEKRTKRVKRGRSFKRLAKFKCEGAVMRESSGR